MPDSQEATRQRNLQMATLDRQEVFRGDCARCHSDPGEGKLGADLFKSVCGVCHEAKVRATMVADLQNLNHPTDYDFWKMTITIGKPGTLMPAFANVAGGPLTDEQIDSLAKFLVTQFPSHATNSAATSVVSPPPAAAAGAKN
jgi:mono/diheme cytochrome c family protein